MYAESCKKLVCGRAAAAGLLLPLLVLVVLKTDFLPQVTHVGEASITQIPDFFFSLRPYGRVPLLKTNKVQYPSATKENVDQSVTQDQKVSSPDRKHEKEFLANNGETDAFSQNTDVAAPRSKLRCDFSNARMDICAMEGDVRMHGKSATVYVVAASDDSYRPVNGTVTIHPYTRKWEVHTMQMVRKVTIHSSAPIVTTYDPAPPRCTVAHDIPAVAFSTTNAYSENFFHAMDDIIIPLYNTAREYNGHVQLVATNYNRKWIEKYRHILVALSIYPIIDFDADEAVRCFPSIHLGIESHDELMINPALSRKGYSMMDFREFLRSAYSLKHAWADPVNQRSGKRPRLVMVLRRRSRAITNEVEAIATAIEVGFEVVAAGPEMVQDVAQFAEVVNSCNVMVGVHGAGLTNMMFLPHNGTMMQIIPWGHMRDICWHEFGRSLPDMGLRYVEYEVTAEETTLKEVYPKDHAIFTDPISIHKQGFTRLWEIFLNGQNITLDIDRFRGVMQQVYRSVTIT
uniref:Uncharacterized protein n=1 Tax=Avena sativa TaxID=4498 RepID=A0ACD5TSF8_AVESA